MNYEHKMLLYKMYKHRKSKGTSFNFNKESDYVDVGSIERDMKLYVGRGLTMNKLIALVIAIVVSTLGRLL